MSQGGGRSSGQGRETATDYHFHGYAIHFLQLIVINLDKNFGGNGTESGAWRETMIF
jgi:hypothetical protein